MSHQHALTLNGAGRLNALVSDVGVSTPFIGDPKLQNNLSVKSFKGVWDTGATGTVITNKIVSELGLKPTGKKDVSTANGKMTTNTYLVNVYLPMNVVMQGVTVTEGSLHNIDLLIGMDIITAGDFSITNKNGKTKMSFGLPSYEDIDYVERLNRLNPSLKIGRNDKCPCKSGKKFKNCCGN